MSRGGAVPMNRPTAWVYLPFFRRRRVDQTPWPVIQAALIVCRSGKDAVIVGRSGGPNRRITGEDAARWLAAAEFVFSGENGLRLLVPAEALDPHTITSGADLDDP